MSPFTGLDHECIYSLVISTSPSCPFSWGDIALLVSPSVAGSEIASSTNVLVHSFLCPTPCLCFTPTYQASLTVHHPDTLSLLDPYHNLVQRHQCPSDDERSQTAGLQFSYPVIIKYMKWPSSNPGPASAALHHHFNFTWYLCRWTDTSYTHKFVHRIALSPQSLARMITLQG